MSVTKDAPVGALAGLSALPKNTLENFAKWGAALVRQPLVRTPPLPPSAFIAIILTLAVAIVAMFGIDTAASDWAHHLPRWFIDAFEEITNFGLGGWFLIPSAFVFLCLAAVAAPTLPRITQGVLAALAARFGFLFLAVGAPGLFDTIIKRLIGRARPYVGSHDDPFAYMPLHLAVGICQHAVRPFRECRGGRHRDRGAVAEDAAGHVGFCASHHVQPRRRARPSSERCHCRRSCRGRRRRPSPPLVRGPSLGVFCARA